ncbi:MAG TPA: FG-GAP-like repeat-containing protein, partial [Pyrinomonadaceae bacterium]|nr:FG-GAP-like repeat-containing protein [Pyrinomonadaceae bacterium]
MKHFKTRVLLPGLSIVLCVAASLIDQSAATRQNNPPKTTSREDAYRANNIGVALLEQYKHKEAADAFRRALQLEPTLTIARINLGIALFNVPDLPAAQRELQSAATATPTAPQPHYMLGLLAKAQNKPAEAVVSFQKVLAIDSQDVGANVNLGQIYAQQRKYAEAVAVLRTAIAAEPYNTTALYNLGTALIRSGQREEGQKIIQQFQTLRERGSGTTLGTSYLEQGRYAEAISSTGYDPELVDPNPPAVKFTDVTSTTLTSNWPADSASAQNGAVVLFDFDLDGDLDLFEVSGLRQRLARNDGTGKFIDFTLVDFTQDARALAKANIAAVSSAIAGDYDNDGRPDLFILHEGLATLYHNDGNNRYFDVTEAAKIPKRPAGTGATAFVDYDHDGDLDIFISGQPHLLLRNNGDRTFTDQTAEAKLADKVTARAVVPTDFDNRRDVDLLVASPEKVSLWRNMRDGTFRDVSAEVGVEKLKNSTCVAAGDINKDGFTDYFFSNIGFAMNLGSRFQITSLGLGQIAANACQFIDHDNDGLLDLVTSANDGVHVFRILPGRIAAIEQPLPTTRSVVLASGDIDNDGDTDLVFGVPGGGLRIARNDGGNLNGSLRVGLTGRVSNRTGIGSKIEMRSGSLAQKLETYSAYPAPAPADVIFGIGKRAGVDAVRVLWPAGVVQAETEIAGPKLTKSAFTVSLTELDRKPSSCPYLYVWNGERFLFLTDFLGGGEMGHLDAPGIYNTPDPDEYVRIDGDLLKPRNGRYELRITNELEEALFLDHLQLIAVAHPREVEVYPNEGLTVPPPRFKLFTTRNAQPPLTAVDEHGHDVLSRIAHVDRQYPDDFKLHQIRGYADEHALTLQLDKHTGRTLLLMTGWTDYAWSSDNLAASQSGKSLTLPALQVKDKRGEWRTVIENIGIPVGRPQTIVVDLTGKFLSDSREVRLVTNMRIYWDQILVDTSAGNFPTQLTRLAPTVADLRWRGFSLEHSPDARQPMTYDYRNVSFTSPWKVMTGRYTREGDVRQLLNSID